MIFLVWKSCKVCVLKLKNPLLQMSVLFFAAFSALILLQTGAWATESLLNHEKPWKGDLDGMVERRKIRVLVPYSKTFFFLDGATQRGISYEGMQIFGKWLNKQLGTGHLKVRVIMIPTVRDKLFSGLVDGRGDIALGNLTITPERLKIVDFSDPFARGVKEIVVAGQGAPALKSLDDLSGREIFVRTSSSYYESLKDLNEKFVKSGREPMSLLPADESFEDEDLLEMANAGLLSFIVVDEHKAAAWETVFKNVKLYPDIALRTGGETAWAFQKNSPKLKEMVNRFVAALAYQESRIDQSLRSPTGAVGVMQILPATAEDPNVDIPNIEQLENNSHAGVKYLRFLRDRYFEKEPMNEANKMLFTFAAYNAGAARVAKLRSEAEKKGLDPNVWFRNTEIIAAKRIGRETVQYVSNIYKYYTAYRLIMDKLQIKKEAKQKMS